MIDDSVDTLEMYAVALEMSGYRPVTATNAEAALRQVDTQRLDAIVTDLGLVGDRDGWDLIITLKTRAFSRGIPIIVLVDLDHQAGHSGPEIAVAAERAGCAAVVSKPCLPDQLVSVLEQVWSTDTSSVRRKAPHV